ncbi:MAG: apolipoprotein N-acyltransferase [Candidatus Eiseniibacteriota bacterium]
MGVAFLPAPLGFLAYIGYLPLLIALDRAVRSGAGARRLFAIGYAFGVVFFGIGTHWIALLSDVASTQPWIKYPAWLLATLYLALFPGLTTLCCGWLARRVPLAAVFPPALVAIEELRGSGELGFPWFQPGYTQHAYAPVVQLASLGSVTLVTLWIGVVNVLVWRALFGHGRLRAAMGAALALALPWLWGARTLQAAPPHAGTRVALVQGNIPGEIKWSGTHQSEILATFIRLTEQSAADHPAIAIWPETATGSYLRRQHGQASQVLDCALRTGVPIFSGFADYDYGPDGRLRNYNAAGLFAAGEAMGPRYAKRHLVPFGERMPFERLIPALGRLDLGQAEWTAGGGVVLFPSAAGPFACLICFESIFPGLSREAVRAGATWLVNITNDEWFGNSAAIGQHAAMAVFRAAENHVPIARCANTGLTMLIDANGRVTRQLPTFQSAVLVGALSSPGFKTPYTRLGDWPGVLSALMLIAAAGRALTARARAD